mmetsp:Transcript_43037/g.78642  ORF Transcript_43037/g.78642 Transcript_43037/m.78642 type:complete len:581 (+) Transcript_43037:68-1810(+)
MRPIHTFVIWGLWSIPQLTHQCSFLAANQVVTNLAFVNFFLRPRGPDATTHVRFHGFDFIHNLLHMTGSYQPQPFLDGTVTALFNGEIYNWRSLAEEAGGGTYRSDGDAILPAYRAFGDRFVRKLDGEYAIAIFDFGRGTATLATDVFGTKPLWYAVVPAERRIAVATYKSALLRLGFSSEDIQMVGPNRVLTLSLGSFEVLQQAAVFEFDLRQYKQSTTDFVTAFEAAVKKRTKDLEETRRPLFVGLSSGFDSGAIHAALHRQATRHHAFVLLGDETLGIVQERALFSRDTSEVSVVVLSDVDFEAERRWLAQQAEPGSYLGVNFTGQQSVLDDQASVGLSYIVRLSRDRGALCYLSGSGADEVLSDYGFAGEAFCPQSSFGGLFPKNLADVFPWSEFFLSTQRDYLFKEEHVAGAHGVEARYPFLDPRVVQEFLWLAPEVKNSEYKRPLHDAFVEWGYPFEPGKKLGFSALGNLRNVAANDSTALWRIHEHPAVSCGPPPPTPGAVVWCSGGTPAVCEPRCLQNRTPAADTLRCNIHGAWVGRMVCDSQQTLAGEWRNPGDFLPTLWSEAGPRPPVLM